MNPTLLVGVGGVVGALARYVVGTRVETRAVDTLAVNVLGSFALGLLVALPAGDSLGLLAGTGFCGAFTTFSSFAVETARLYETGQRRRAVGNAAVNLAGALAAVGLGSLAAAML